MFKKNKIKIIKDLLLDQPLTGWNDWDLEAFNIIGDIIADRRAVILRDEIARMMELSGQHYAMQKNQYYKKKGLLNDMRERKKDD